METNKNERFLELKSGTSTADRRSPRKLRLVGATALAVAFAMFVPQVGQGQVGVAGLYGSTAGSVSSASATTESPAP